MSAASADRNLLFGLVALQNAFITRDGLVAAFGAWTADRRRSLGTILVERGELTAARRVILESLIDEHIAAHGGDPARSLAGLGPIEPTVARDLGELSDSSLRASLATVGASCETTDPTGLATISLAPKSGGTAADGSRFVPLRPHARGGLGQLYVARDTELDRQVALKELLGHCADDPVSRGRFIVEAEVTGKLEHPGIVPVYGLGQSADGRPFYAMRLIEGGSLQEAIDRFHTPLNPAAGRFASVAFRELLGRFLTVCDAVAYAHSRGVLHRDLKPGNVMLGPFGETLVVDWGLAKVTGRAEDEGGSRRPVKLSTAGGSSAETVAGSTLGTPSYMSPEQAGGRPEDLSPATDVYGLGAILYAILTGRAPVAGSDVGEILRKVAAGDFAAPRSFDPSIPRPLEAICLRAMAIDRKHRYGRATELSDELKRWLADEPVQASPDRWGAWLARRVRRHRSWAWSGAAALVLVGLAGAGFVQQLGRISQRGRHELDLANLRVNGQRHEARTLAAWKGLSLGEDLCEQGLTDRGVHWIARALDEVPADQADLGWEIRTSLAVRRRQIHRLREGLPHEQDVWCAVLSPDGKRALTGGLGGAWLWDFTAGKPAGRRLVEGISVPAADFSPDGRVVLTATVDGELRLWDAATGAQVGPSMRHGPMIRGLVFSPDGRRAVTYGYTDGRALVWDITSGQKVELSPPHQGHVWSAAFSRDGKVVATGGTDAVARLWDAATGAAIGSPMQHERTTWVRDLSFHPDGTALLTAGNDGTARLWDATSGASLGPPMRHTDSVPAAAFSPDGKTFVTGCGDGSVWRWDWDTRSRIGEPLRHPALDRPASIVSIRFTPRGGSFLTTSENGTACLWDVDTGRAIGGPMEHPEPLASGAIDAEGRWVLTSGKDKVARLWEVSRSRASRPAFIHGKWIRAAAFSPDGRRVLTGGDDGAARLWDAATGAAVGPPLRHGGAVLAAAFSPDGGRVLTAGADGAARLWDSETGAPGLTLRHPKAVHAAAISPDSRRVLTGGDDGVARLWDAATGAAVGPPLQHGGAVLAAAFSPDGRAVATGGADRKANVWEAASGRRIRAIPQQQLGYITAIAYTPDGEAVLTGAADGTARFWDASAPDEEKADRLGLWVEVATNLEREDGGEFRALRHEAWERSRSRLAESAGTADRAAGRRSGKGH